MPLMMRHKEFRDHNGLPVYRLDNRPILGTISDPAGLPIDAAFGPPAHRPQDGRSVSGGLHHRRLQGIRPEITGFLLSTRSPFPTYDFSATVFVDGPIRFYAYEHRRHPLRPESQDRGAATMRVNILAQRAWNPAVTAEEIAVDLENGTAMLTGTVDS